MKHGRDEDRILAILKIKNLMFIKIMQQKPEQVAEQCTESINREEQKESIRKINLAIKSLKVPSLANVANRGSCFCFFSRMPHDYSSMVMGITSR